MIKVIENIVFALRIPILIAFAVITVWMAILAVQLRMDAGFYKQLPQGHPYIDTFLEYQDRLFGSNRIIVVVRNTEGDVWNQDFMKRLKQVTDDLFFLPGVDRRTVTSLWTPNTRLIEITEEGLTARDVIPGRVTPDNMTEENIAQLRNDVIKGGFVGRLVSNDFTASMIVAELQELDPRTGERLDYFDLGAQLEEKIREKYEDGPYEIHIIGFAKMISDIADGAQSVVLFFGLAFVLTALAVYYYARSWALVFLAMFCSFTSLIWQFGILDILGFGLDPLAVLVPFLVFAIGVSHGVQQLNLISATIIQGGTPEQAARASFSGLLIPGSMALTTDLVGFATLYLIPIPMIQELAITASIGVALKIVTNLIMLPLVASYMKFDDGYRKRVEKARNGRVKVMRVIGRVAERPVAYPLLAFSLVIFGVAVWQSLDRHIGDLHPGAPELRADERYNVDSRIVAEKFTIGLDLLTVIIETPPLSCVNYPYMDYLNRFSWHMENTPGVRSVASIPFAAKQIAAGWNEGNLKWRTLPREQTALVQATSPVGASSGLLDADCTLLPLQIFLEDGRAETIKTAVDSVKTFIATQGLAPALNRGIDLRAQRLGPDYDEQRPNQPSDPTSQWLLTKAELNGLTLTRPLMSEDPLRLTVHGYGPGQTIGAPLAQTSIDLPAAAPGESQPVDLASAIAGAEWAGVTQILVDGVPDSLYIRLASGNSGVAAATNEEIHRQELPMILIVYGVIIVLVFLTYWDWRATVCCCLPLTIGTFLGYWFMKEMEIGLKVSTLPVMVLAVGIGVDYAYYIYNRLQYHLSQGLDVTSGYKESMLETGMAVVFTAVTFAIGVSTWSFSPLKFQADMGMLLTFMFMINMLMSITVLPSFAVVLDDLFPRKRPVKAPSMAH